MARDLPALLLGFGYGCMISANWRAAAVAVLALWIVVAYRRWVR